MFERYPLNTVLDSIKFALPDFADVQDANGTSFACVWVFWKHGRHANKEDYISEKIWDAFVAGSLYTL